jgi:hypothetical protein
MALFKILCIDGGGTDMDCLVAQAHDLEKPVVLCMIQIIYV